MSKLAKRGRNPGAVDNWLENLGLYRKNVAYDETCLFRAVSEQLYDCQVYHERVRKECVTYARENFDQFSHLVESFEDWQEHLDLLEKHMVVCGKIEINIISIRYSRDVLIFDAAHHEVYKATDNNFPSTLLLCLLDEDHYDVVYEKEHIVTAAIVYKLLYEGVFNIPNVDDIVKHMLYEKNIITQAEALAEKNKLTTEVNNNEVSSPPKEQNDCEVVLANNNIAPFPFKVAKALDPTIYRNIEYDSWGEVRREMRLGEWYYGDDKLILGTRCILNDKTENEIHDCYIQEIIKDQNKCVVYLTKLAEKRTVDYSDLSPENDAKPWPLPYRFSKSLVIAGLPAPVVEKSARNIKRRTKEKRGTKSCSENINVTIPSSPSTSVSEVVENVDAYVGVPLQMQSPTETAYREPELTAETQTEPIGPDQQISQEVQTSPARYQWNQTQWHHFLPPTPDSMVWPQTPTSQGMFNFNVKPMVASAPVTPDVVPYHNANYPYYYNYHVEPYQQYNAWQPQTMDLPQTVVPKMEKPHEDICKSEMRHTGAHPVYYSENDNRYEVASPERPTVYTTATPQNSPIEIYSPMIQLPSAAPLIFAPAPPPEITEVVVTSPPVLYTPPVDVQYISPTPYVYPPTPPATWYPAGVNSHGFIFPSRPQ